MTHFSKLEAMLREGRIRPGSTKRRYRDHMRDIGIRPPTRYTVTERDLAPPVKQNPWWVALLLRIRNRFR